MIAIWNRELLLETYDMAKQGAVRQLLAQNDIPYTYKTVGGPMMQQSMPTGRIERQLQYKIYVYKKDHGRASRILYDMEKESSGK